MIEIVLLEIISITSLIFAILSNLFEFTTLNNYFLIFLYSIFCSAIYSIKSDKKINRLSLLLLLAPLLIFREIVAIYFFLGLGTILYFYLTRSLSKGNYNNQVDSLKKSMFLLLGLFIFAFIGENLNRIIVITLPFLTIYLLSTLILIRNLRHINLGMDINLIRKSNRRYLLFIIVVSSLITMDDLRNNLFRIISNIFEVTYSFIIDILFKILYYPITWILFVIEKFINWIITMGNLDNGEQIQIEMGEGEIVVGSDFITREVPLLNGALKIIFFLAIIYLIYRIIKRTGERKIDHANYIEEREFIKKTKDKKHKKYLTRKPKDLDGQIRYYYERYLLMLKKSNIDISNFDTSEEINNKAKEKYSIKIINEFRNIYIKIRYGFTEGDSKTIKEMEDLYKEIKKASKEPLR